MSKPEELKIKIWEAKGIIGNYVNLYITELPKGAVVGGYIGATIGFITGLGTGVLVGRYIGATIKFITVFCVTMYY